MQFNVLSCFCCASLPACCMQTLVSNNVSLSLSAAVALAAAQQPLSVSQQQQEAVMDFVGRRLEQLLMDAGVSAEAGETASVAGCCCVDSPSCSLPGPTGRRSRTGPSVSVTAPKCGLGTRA